MSLNLPAKAQRLVFAHYMLTNQDYQGDDGTAAAQELKISSYEREIKEAQAAGIDGFALNAGGWLHESYYIRYAAQMFEAAARLHSSFHLMFSADMCCGNAAADIEDMMRRFAGNPRYAEVYFRYRGAFVLTTFSGEKLGPSFWQQVRNDLANGTNPSTSLEPTALKEVAGPPGAPRLPIFFVPAFFWGGELPHEDDIGKNLNTWSQVIDGAFYWGIAGLPGSGGEMDQLLSNDAYAHALHSTGKLYMAPVAPAFWGSNANRYYEYNGYEGMRSMWKSAAEVTKPDWVEIITWNDFIEGTYVSPIDDPNRYPNASFLNASGIPVGTQDYFPTHSGMTALLPWFIRWYKTGTEPPVTRDIVAIAYRSTLAADSATPSVAHRYGGVSATLYITVNSTGPAELIVTMRGTRRSFAVPAGSHDYRVPLLPGPPPVVELERGNVQVCKVRGGSSVVGAAAFNNLYVSTASCTTP
ncbi:glycoside hydrolase family 71 protein [Bryocella elongata]|nr:glycoside hydrolase family 71 protein [Bryocella elongata]